MKSKTVPVLAGVLVVLVLAVGGLAYALLRPTGGGTPATTPPAGEATTAVKGSPKPSPSAADPYAVYLKIAPKGAVHLSREDAQARALLGCGQDWAPGTVDAALAKAYASLCKKN